MSNSSMITKREALKRTKYMFVEAGLLIVVFFFFGYYLFILGLAIGTGAGVLNYWLVTKAVLRGAENPETATHSKLMKRYLWRLVIAGTVIVGSALVDIGLLMGAVVGLTLEMQTYLWEAIGQMLGQR